MQIGMTVNGAAQDHDVEPRTLLVQYLREACATHRHQGRVRHVVVRRVHGARSTASR